MKDGPGMSDDPGEVPAEQHKPFISFHPVISLGNLLIIAGMVSSLAIALFTMGGSMQRLQDAITHEAELRVDSEKNIADKIADSQRTEARDVQAIGQSLTDLKTDMRELVKASTPQPDPRRR
jgi:hypothetical protein